MTIDLLKDKGTPVDKQLFIWKELVRPPYSKLDDDAFRRVRVTLMNGLEAEALRFAHVCGRLRRELQPDLARLRRAEQGQQTMVNWLNPADQTVLETTIGYEQVAVEVTAAVAQADANNLLQSYTDVLPGRPTAVEHRAPEDNLRAPYDRNTARLLTKLHALTLVGGEYQTHDYYMNVGPIYPDPLGRQLYAEIASIEEQHVTQYESIIDTEETLLEKLLLTQAMEAYNHNYYSCAQYEDNRRIKAIWERFLDYELNRKDALIGSFERALAEEREHLANVRTWLAAAQNREPAS